MLNQLRRDSTGEATIDELVDALLRAEADGGIARTDGRDHLLVELHHTHLPKLEAHGVVEYDAESCWVRYQPDERLEAVLDSLPETCSEVTRSTRC